MSSATQVSSFSFSARVFPVSIVNNLRYIVGLFNTLSSGVAELFYEPYQGVIMSDRPQDLGIGIARVCH